MRQTFLHYIANDDATLRGLTSRLEAAGFHVAPAPWSGPAIYVRVREGTGDTDKVESIVSEVAPGVTRGSNGAPTMRLVGYRENT